MEKYEFEVETIGIGQGIRASYADLKGRVYSNEEGIVDNNTSVTLFSDQLHPEWRTMNRTRMRIFGGEMGSLIKTCVPLLVEKIHSGYKIEPDYDRIRKILKR